MITPLLKTALEPVVSRHRLLRYLRLMALWLAAFIALGLALYAMRDRFTIPAVLVFIALFLVARVVRRRVDQWQPDYLHIARCIEERHPELHALLRTAVEQRPDPETGRMHFLQQRLMQQVAEEGRKSNWLDAVPDSRLWSHAGIALALFAALAFIFTQIHLATRRTVRAVAAKNAEPVTVTPGDVSLERGAGLIVLAKFNRDVPGEATLVLESRNEPARRIPLIRNLDDPVFGGGLPEVKADLSYRIEYAGKATRDFAVKVFEHPRLDRADAVLHFPEYTKLPGKKLPDTHRVSAVEGTKLDVEFQLNKPVKSATLVAKDGATVPLAIQDGKPLAELRDFAVKKGATYELKLVDADGRANKLPAQFIVDAVPNRRPELKFQTPKGDQRVSPIEEVAFRAQAWDDFGLSRYGLTVNVAGRGEQEIELGRDTRADERREFSHVLKLEDLGVKPDELVTWFLWAEDTGPDGKPRRTASDMYFGEVRPFEEIYRAGDGSEGNSAAAAAAAAATAGEQATKLADMQKQIITATWNLKRSEEATIGAKSPTEKYLKDEPVIRDSQGDALTKAQALADNAEDAKAKALVARVTLAMQTAHDHLAKAAETPAPLPDALTAEQSAYDALLKLAAHEFRVVRNQQSQSAAAASQSARQRQQLDQLEMKDEKKRYETKSEAQPQQPEPQREQLAILNRLKELSQRQNDINERLKELQTALQEAKSEQQKDDVRRQLQRLREEEQQLLADMDETRQKMEQSTQQSQLADERQQLDKTRGEAQEAAEAMQKNAPSQALASGTRTARDLQQMRDDFRKKTSGQFTDEMREMRADARELAQNQQALAEKLNEKPAQPQRRTLDGSGEREQLAQQFEKQQAQLAKITDQMKRVSEQAEAAEPLLAKELYDTLRKTTQAGTGGTLEKTEVLARNGYANEARKFEEKARQEIDELKNGVERAAGSVLGDEAESLRQARAEIDTLAQQLDRELAQARPDLAQRDAAENGGAKSRENAGAPRDAGGDVPAAAPGDAQKNDAANGNATPRDPRSGNQQARREDGNANDSQNRQPGTPGNRNTAQGDQAGNARPGQQTNEPGQGGRQSAQRGQSQPGEQNAGEPSQDGQQPGQGRQQGGQAAQRPGGQGRGQTAQQPGGNPDSQTPGEGQAPGANGRGRTAGGRLAQLSGPSPRTTAGQAGGGGGTSGGAFLGQDGGPLTGENFSDWSDRLRNVEEMIDDPALRTEAARIRDTAKGVRTDYKRNAAQPDWDLVKSKISTPLVELRNRLTEELARRESKENLVPIDRDPVPTKYAERVRRYYEELGRSR
jgi:hypothetical protein